jgi:hypothetical protein
MALTSSTDLFPVSMLSLRAIDRLRKKGKRLVQTTMVSVSKSDLFHSQSRFLSRSTIYCLSVYPGMYQVLTVSTVPTVPGTWYGTYRTGYHHFLSRSTIYCMSIRVCTRYGTDSQYLVLTGYHHTYVCRTYVRRTTSACMKYVSDEIVCNLKLLQALLVLVPGT